VVSGLVFSKSKMPCEPESRCSFTLYPKVAVEDAFTHVIYSQMVFNNGNSKFRCPKHEKTFDGACHECQKGKMADNFRMLPTGPAACNIYAIPVQFDGVQKTKDGVRIQCYDSTVRSSWTFEMFMIENAMCRIPTGARLLVLTQSRLWEKAEIGGLHPARHVGVPEQVTRWAERFEHLVFDVVVGSQAVARSREFAYTVFIDKNPVTPRLLPIPNSKFVINSNGVYNGYRNKVVKVGTRASAKRLKRVEETKKGEFRKADYLSDLYLVIIEKDPEKAESLLDLFECSLESYFGRSTLSRENAQWCKSKYEEAVDKVKFRDPSYLQMFDMLCIEKPDDALKFVKHFQGATQESISRFLSFRCDLDVNRTMELLLPHLSDDD